MIPKTLVIADDFTGANDTGVQMRKRGVPVEVILFPDEKAGRGSVVLDTESRNIPAAEAAEKVRKLMETLYAHTSFPLVYKKVDSTLRGNIAAEIAAVREVAPLAKVLFAPALPKIGRTTVDGIHRLNGVPLLQTEMAKDPAAPITTDSLPELLAPFGDVRHHALENVRAGELPLAGAVHTFDAETEEDLARIVEAGRASDEPVLWVGSAGLADALFAAYQATKPSLAVVGSVSATSFAQLAYAEERGATVVQFSAEEVLAGDTDRALRELNEALEDGRDTILTSARSREDYDRTIAMAKQQNLNRVQTGHKVQAALATVLADALDRTEVSGIFLTGGDTAIAVIRELEAAGCRIEREVLTGTVLSTLSGGRADGLPIFTKAGAFGTDSDLWTSLARLKESVS